MGHRKQRTIALSKLFLFCFLLIGLRLPCYAATFAPRSPTTPAAPFQPSLATSLLHLAVMRFRPPKWMWICPLGDCILERQPWDTKKPLVTIEQPWPDYERHHHRGLFTRRPLPLAPPHFRRNPPKDATRLPIASYLRKGEHYVQNRFIISISLTGHRRSFSA